MNDSYLILLVVFLFVMIRIARERKLTAIKHILNRKNRNEENSAMKELVRQFIGKECLIYTITSDFGSIQGVVKEIDDGGLVIERKNGEREIINLDYVIRIRDYPRKKNGKKKEIVLD